MLYAIRLTLTDTDDRAVFLMLEHVSHVEITENLDTVVAMANGDRFNVRESASDVVQYFLQVNA